MSQGRQCPQCGAGYSSQERFCMQDGVALVDLVPSPAAGPSAAEASKQTAPITRPARATGPMSQHSQRTQPVAVYAPETVRFPRAQHVDVEADTHVFAKADEPDTLVLDRHRQRPPQPLLIDPELDAEPEVEEGGEPARRELRMLWIDVQRAWLALSQVMLEQPCPDAEHLGAARRRLDALLNRFNDLCIQLAALAGTG